RTDAGGRTAEDNDSADHRRVVQSKTKNDGAHVPCSVVCHPPSCCPKKRSAFRRSVNPSSVLCYCSASATNRSSPSALATSSSAERRPSFLSLSILAWKSSALATDSCAISTIVSPALSRLSDAGELASTPRMTTPFTVSLILYFVRSSSL